MKEILNSNLNHARNAEHFQFHSDVLAVFTSALAKKHGIEALRETYALLFAQEDATFIQNRAYEATQEIVEKDRTRDELFLYIKQTVDSNLYCPLAEKKAAASKLSFALHPYRSANIRPYAENTAQLTNFVDDLQSSSYASYAATLGLTDAIRQLKEANDAFNAVYAGRSGEKLTRVSTDNMKTIRPKVDNAYQAVASAINALYQVNELVTRTAATSESLGKIIDGINALIIQLQQTLSWRGAGNKPSAPDGPPEEGGTVIPKPDPTPDPDDGGGEAPDPMA